MATSIGPRARPRQRPRPCAIFALATAAACGLCCVDLSYDPGVVVEVALDGRPRPSRFTTDRGFEAELDHAYVALESVELLDCPASAARRLFGLGVAHAHSASTRTRLGTSFVFDLAAEQPRLAYGSFAPPPGSFCSLRVTFGPADGDAVNGPADGHLLGLTLLVQGRYRRAGERAFRPLVLASAAKQIVTVPFERVHLDAPGITNVVLALGRDGRWLDGASLDDASAARVVFERVTASLEALP